MKKININGKTYFIYSVPASYEFTAEGLFITYQYDGCKMTTTFFDPMFYPPPKGVEIKYTGHIWPDEQDITGFKSDFDYAKTLLLYIGRMGGFVMPTKCAVQNDERLIDHTCITPYKQDALKSTFESWDIELNNKQIIIFEKVGPPDPDDEEPIQPAMSGKVFMVDMAGISELEKCKSDPVYFYENYFRVEGKKPIPLDEESKKWLRNQYKLSQIP